MPTRFSLSARSAATSAASRGILLLVTVITLALGAALLVSGLRGRSRPTGRASSHGQSPEEAVVVREGNAQTIFLRARDAVTHSRWLAAEEHLRILNRDYPQTAFYAAHRAEIAEFERATDEGKRWKAPVSPDPARPLDAPDLPRGMPEELVAALRAQDPDYWNHVTIRFRGDRAPSLTLASHSVQSLAPLRGLKLVAFYSATNLISDLSPLEGMPLEELTCTHNRITSLAPLKGMPLVRVQCYGNQIADLSPLRGMALSLLDCSRNQIVDLSALRGMPLVELYCNRNPIADLSPLRGLPLQKFDCCWTQVTDLAPLAGMPLKELDVTGAPVHDPSILRAMPLRKLALTYRKVHGDLQILRDHPTLEQIRLGSSSWMSVEAFRMALDVEAGRRPRPPLEEFDNRDARWRDELDRTLGKKISFDFAGAPVKEAIAFIGKQAHGTYVLDARALTGEPKRVTLRVDEMPPSEAVAKVAEQVGLVPVRLDGATFITTPELAKTLAGGWPDRREEELPPLSDYVEWFRGAWPRVSFGFDEMPLKDAILALRIQIDQGISLGPPAVEDEPRPVTLRASEMRGINALRWVCRTAGVAYIWRDGIFFVGTPERIREAVQQERELYAPQVPPREFEAAMARPVYFDFVGKPLADVASWFRQTAGVPVEVDSEAFAGNPPPLTLRITDRSCDRALRWIGRLTRTVPVWRAGKILLTTPERAKRP